MGAAEVAAFYSEAERDPADTQLLNDLEWLIIIPAFPTLLGQFLGLALGTLADRSPRPVYPRWVAYFNIWVGLLFVPGGVSYFFRTGPFAWCGLLAFWVVIRSAGPRWGVTGRPGWPGNHPRAARSAGSPRTRSGSGGR
jgi:hypothetical protein